VLPFIHRFISYKTNYLCCVSETPLGNISLDDIKRKLYNGLKVSQCDVCYRNEQNGIMSNRLRENNQWLPQYPELLSEIKDWYHNSIPLEVYYYDIRYGNKCNLSCICCRPTASSFKANELGIPNHYNDVVMPNIDLSSVTKIYLAGGEPLIIDGCLKIINDISLLPVDQQPELVINTNLSRINAQLKQDFTQIKKLSLVISIDAFGAVNEYHRWPLHWDKFVHNLEYVADSNIYLMVNTVVDAISIINCADIRLLEDMIDNWNLTVINDLYSASLFIENIPTIHKAYVKDNFSNIKKSRFFTENDEFKRTVNLILSKISEPGNPQSLAEFVKKNDELRNINHVDYLKINLY